MTERGSIVLLGGAEESDISRQVLRKLVRQTHKHTARFLILAAASRLERTGRELAETLEEEGALEAKLAFIDKRTDGESADLATQIERADAIVLTGVNPLKLTTNLGGTTLARTIRRRNSEGLCVAGFGAGAAYICGHMITYGDVGTAPRAEKVTLTPGLGLINSVVVDQRYHQRGPGRLLTALAYNPFALGIGLDKGTAALIDANYELTVEGDGVITIIDPSELEHSSADSAAKDEAVCLVGLKLHTLTQGTSFNIKTQKVTLPEVAGLY